MDRLHQPQCHDDLLNYRLKRLLTLGGAPAIRLCEGRYGIPRLEWRLVAALVESGAMSPSELARCAHVDPARVSNALRRLVAKGFVQRTALPGNARRATIAATAEGEALYRSLWPRLAAINRRLMDALDDGEALVLDRCLTRLTALAEQIHEEGGGVEELTDRRLGGSRRFWAASID